MRGKDVDPEMIFAQLGQVAMRVIPTTAMTRGRQNPMHFKFPLRLRRARRDREMSGAALSVAAGLGHSGASALEAKLRLPRVHTAELLADVLRVSPGWLAFGFEAPWVPLEGEGLRCAGMGARALEVRTVKGISQRAVDRNAGCAEGTIRSIESGTMPTIDTLEDMARALGVSPAWLAYGIEPMQLPARRRAMSPGADRSGPPQAR